MREIKPHLPGVSLALALDLGLALGLSDEMLSRRALQREGASLAVDQAIVRKGLLAVATLIAAVGVIAVYTSSNPELGGKPLMLWQGQHAVGQREAIKWVLDNVPPDGKLVIDMYMWTDLREVPAGKQPFTQANYYFKVDLDPTVKAKMLGGDWRNVDYVIATIQLANDVKYVDSLTIVRQALGHSRVVTTFGTGWPVEIRKMEPSR